jgi:hypothetical protein
VGNKFVGLDALTEHADEKRALRMVDTCTMTRVHSATAAAWAAPVLLKPFFVLIWAAPVQNPHPATKKLPTCLARSFTVI